jgi:hypothetical protein
MEPGSSTLPHFCLKLKQKAIGAGRDFGVIPNQHHHPMHDQGELIQIHQLIGTESKIRIHIS